MYKFSPVFADSEINDGFSIPDLLLVNKLRPLTILFSPQIFPLVKNISDKNKNRIYQSRYRI